MPWMVAVQNSKKSEQPGVVEGMSAHGRGPESRWPLKSSKHLCSQPKPFCDAMTLRPCQSWPQWFGKPPCLQHSHRGWRSGAALPCFALEWAELSVHCQDGTDVTLSRADGGQASHAECPSQGHLGTASQAQNRWQMFSCPLQCKEV